MEIILKVIHRKKEIFNVKLFLGTTNVISIILGDPP
jgi:hypothetical protein